MVLSMRSSGLKIIRTCLHLNGFATAWDTECRLPCHLFAYLRMVRAKHLDQGLRAEFISSLTYKALRINSNCSLIAEAT